MVNGIPTSVTPLSAQVPSNVGPSGANGMPQHPQQQRPGQYASPVMINNQQPPGPQRSQPVQMMQPRAGTFSMNVSPQQQPGAQPPPPPYAVRPASRAGTPLGMRPQQSSPQMQAQQVDWKREWQGVKAQLCRVPEGHWKDIRAEAGLPDRVDLNVISDQMAVCLSNPGQHQSLI